MASDRILSLDLQTRVEALAARSSLSVEDILTDALRNGRSLDWQEQFVAQVERGVAAADRGEFATPADVRRVLDKHRQA